MKPISHPPMILSTRHAPPSRTRAHATLSQYLCQRELGIQRPGQRVSAPVFGRVDPEDKEPIGVFSFNAATRDGLRVEMNDGRLAEEIPGGVHLQTPLGPPDRKGLPVGEASPFL